MQVTGPPPHPQAFQDAEHLKLLSIFHYVLAGFYVLGGCFPLIYLAMGIFWVSGGMSSATTPPGSTPPPPELGWIFIAIGAVGSLIIWAYAFLMFLCARWVGQRQRRTFCFVMACLSCAMFPLGTALGVFTIIVLSRPSVKALFDQPLPGGYLNR